MPNDGLGKYHWRLKSYSATSSSLSTPLVLSWIPVVSNSSWSRRFLTREPSSTHSFWLTPPAVVVVAVVVRVRCWVASSQDCWCLVISQEVSWLRGWWLVWLLWFPAHVFFLWEEVSSLTLAEHFLHVTSRNEPSIVWTRSLSIHSVAALGLVPEHEPRSCVALTLRPPLLLVVPEHEGWRTGTLAVPLVTLLVLRPVVLIVPRTAATVSTVTLARVGFKHHQLTQRTGALTSHLVTVSLTRIWWWGEIQVSSGAGILRTEANTITALH